MNQVEAWRERLSDAVEAHRVASASKPAPLKLELSRPGRESGVPDYLTVSVGSADAALTVPGSEIVFVPAGGIPKFCAWAREILDRYEGQIDEGASEGNDLQASIDDAAREDA